MIIGLGSDLIDIRRISRSIERFGDRFTHRVFTQIERDKADSRYRRVETYAKRFAAKEACAKALGTGIYKGVAWQQLEVINLPSGKPSMNLTGKALERLNNLIPEGHKANLQLTITDDHPWALAYVIIEAIAEP